MSTEHALVTRARPQMLAAMALSVLRDEARKGCGPELSPDPVLLEPPYRDFSTLTSPQDAVPDLPFVRATPPAFSDIHRLSIWLPPGHVCEWNKAERLLKEVQSCEHTLAFEIMGNAGGVALGFAIHVEDAPRIAAAFLGEYPECRLERSPRSWMENVPDAAWEHILLREFYPSPPYSHLFTRPGELHESPLEPLIHNLGLLPDNVWGLYQVLCVPVLPRHDWHRNVRLLLDVEFRQKQYEGAQAQYRYAQQLPSADLRGMALDADEKSHNDKPMFAAVARTVLLSDAIHSVKDLLAPLSVFLDLFQHGGRPLRFIDQTDYLRVVSQENIRDAVLGCRAHRPGFLLNSEELSGFVHFISVPEDVSRRANLIHVLDGFASPSTALDQGKFIGYRKSAAGNVPVHIPAPIRGRHGHIIGVSGMGKSYFIENMVLQDIWAGEGAAIIDPHGDLVQRLLGLIPEDSIDRVAYFYPCDPGWTPMWNILAPSGLEPSRVGDELTSAFRSISEGWGDRLAHLLRNVLTGLITLGDATLLDVQVLLGGKSREREHLKRRIADRVRNPASALFWEHDLDAYSKADVQPVLHKIGKLLSQNSVARMLGQKENRFDFTTFLLGRGKIFLANLAGMGPAEAGVIGSFLVSRFYLAALGRSGIPSHERCPFHLYVDEAPRFISGPMTELIEQTRKHNVSITVANQFASQFSLESQDALGTTGFTIIFNVLNKDAHRLVQTIGGEIEPKNLARLQPREAIARIGTEWVKIETPEQPEHVNEEIKARVIASSHDRYCTRTEVLDSPRKAPWDLGPNPARNTAHSGEREEDFAYDSLT